MKKIVILGIGGNCIDILDTINEINRAGNKQKYKCVGFLDDNKNKWNKTIYGIKVLGPLDYACIERDKNNSYPSGEDSTD